MRRDPAKSPDAFGVADEVATDAEEDEGVEDEAEECGEPFLRETTHGQIFVREHDMNGKLTKKYSKYVCSAGYASVIQHLNET